MNVNLPLLGMRYPAPLQVVHRCIGVLRFDLGMMDALQINVVHDVIFTYFFPSICIGICFLTA